MSNIQMLNRSRLSQASRALRLCIVSINPLTPVRCSIISESPAVGKRISLSKPPDFPEPADIPVAIPGRLSDRLGLDKLHQPDASQEQARERDGGSEHGHDIVRRSYDHRAGKQADR